MKKTCTCLLGFIVCSSLLVPAYAQTSKLEVHIYRFFSSADNEATDGDIEHTWKLFFKDDAAAAYGVERCHSLTTGHNVTNLWHDVNDTYVAKYYYTTVPGTFYFHLRGYEDDAGDRCEENSRDEQKESYFDIRNLADLRPGVWSQRFTFGGGRYWVEYALRYTPIAPTVQSVTPNIALICSDAPVTLTAAINVPNTSGLSYQWQYNIQGQTEANPNYTYCADNCYFMLQECEMNQWGNCYEYYYQCLQDCDTSNPPLPVWKDLGSSSTNTMTFQPDNTVFPGGLTSNAGVQFRVKAYTAETSSAYGATSGFKTFSPAAPTSSSSPYVKQPACLSGEGIIALDNISKPFSAYRYILKSGDLSTLGCEPQTNDCLVDVVASGESTSSSLEIGGLSEGTYSLFLLNPGGSEGVCPRRIGGPIIVPRIPDLNVSPGTPSMIACNGSNTGSVEVTVTGGRQSLISYTLSNQTDGKSWSTSTNTTNPVLTFDGLSPGAYLLTSTDGCTQPSAKAFNIREQAKILLTEFQQSPASCNVPGNGEMRVTVSRSTGDYITTVSNLYTYTLLKNGTSFRTLETTDASVTWQSLPPANYTLIVKEKGGDTCNQYEHTFTIAPPQPLGIQITDVKAVSCFNGTDGTITVTAAGGTGSYVFTLSGAMTATGNEPVFSALKAGDYSITVRNQLAGCEDSFTTSVTVGQPTELKALISKDDITCFDQNDGTLTSVVTGGVPDYSYTWQTLINGSWLDMSTTGPLVNGRQEGDYRLIARDGNQCSAVSNVVTIARPEPMQIDSIKVFDIKCLGEAGHVQVYGTGGTGELEWQYKAEESPTFTTFTEETSIWEGRYRVRIQDANGCTLADDANTYVITAPPSALDFTFEKSEFNGYNISCNNGSDGRIVITPDGGNGHVYSGYEFRADGNPFAVDHALNNLTAGDHLIAVRDGRGCVVEKSINFSQAPALTVSTNFKKDVDCYGEPTGILELTVSGGAGTFQYTLGNVTQGSGRFENLYASEYTFQILDVNECETTYSETIVNLHEPITSSVAVNDVLCYGGSDGVIDLSVQGGDSEGYAYELVGMGSRANPITALAAGTYSVVIADAKGCRHEVNDIVIGEPDPLEIDSVKYHDVVCFGETGTISVFSSGGTYPYILEYAASRESAFTPFTDATPLAPAIYELRVVDDHGCITPYNGVVTLTSPSAPLDFSYELSDYNGYNISCFGGDNGYVDVIPVGGNGANYTGYEFSLDDRTFQSDIRIRDIDAGIHKISIRDGRNCIVTKDVLFSQSDNRLAGRLLNKKDVNCFYERNGSVEVVAEGGVSPYQYWIDPMKRQDVPVFNGLAVGDFVVTISDMNECKTDLSVNISSVYPAFAVTSEVTNVNCHGGEDGAVNMIVTGGVPPFRYNWKDQSEESDLLENVRQGAFEVTITDDAGCFVTAYAQVDEPDQSLTISGVSTEAACYDQDNGLITIAAEGGTSPYRYSINNGQTYYENASIKTKVGTFDIVVQDVNGCLAESLANVDQRNSRPEPNFLVSSKQNALDTLVLTDISIPKPDSIDWDFHSSTQLLNNSQWTPEIFFTSEGDYPVTMISYFGDCAYQVTKTIFLRPFDPDRREDDLPNASPIESVEVTPNPNDGRFAVTVKLNRKRNLSLMVYNVTGNILFRKSYEETDEVVEEVDIADNASGVYVIRAITETDAREVRIVVNH